MIDFDFDLVTQQTELNALVATLTRAAALAIDIETVNWWDPQSERIALIQFAYRLGAQRSSPTQVAILDALEPDLDLATALRPALERAELVKVMHNASFDAVRLQRHLQINTTPIHDTMSAARRSGERNYSLQALALKHLGIRLNKYEQRGDWSSRPLSREQLQYSAMDAVTTLLIYEQQARQGLKGFYKLRSRDSSKQGALPIESRSELPVNSNEIIESVIDTSPEVGSLSTEIQVSQEQERQQAADDDEKKPIGEAALAFLGVVTQLPDRYSPDRLVVSLSASSARVGLAGWTVDKIIGADTDLDEDAARIAISELYTAGLIRTNEDRHLEPTGAGLEMWEKYKA